MEVETVVCAKLFRGETEQVRKVIEIKKEKGNEVKGGNYMLDQSYYQKTDEIIEHYGRKAASLIPIMQDIQAEYRENCLLMWRKRSESKRQKPTAWQHSMKTFPLNRKESM